MVLTERYLPYYTVEDRNRWQGDWELVEGIPYALASPSIEHQRVLRNLIVELSHKLQNCENCEVIPDIDYYISEDTVVRPDLIVVYKGLKEKLTVPPNIVFEIVSPTSVKVDEHIKFELYQREGVLYYCLVYPVEDRKHIKVFKLKEGKYTKVFDTVNDSFSFDLQNCKFNLDFSKIW
ncbi:MAG: Uma2 family endonuclease [Aquificae bacterium]|nr:Uma2 family endonuclease [Aquificota bacterium]